MGELFRCDLRPAQPGGIEDDENLRQHHAVLRRTDTVMTGDDFYLSVDESAERKAFKLSTLLDVIGELLLHLGLHNASIDVLLTEIGQLDLCDDETMTHVSHGFVGHCCCDLVFSLCLRHLSSPPNHSFNACLAFLSFRGDS